MIIYMRTTRGMGRMQVSSETRAAQLEATGRWVRCEPVPTTAATAKEPTAIVRVAPVAPVTPAAPVTPVAPAPIKREKQDHGGGLPPTRSIDQ